MASQVFEFVFTELKHEIVWEAREIPFNGTNQLPGFYTIKARPNQYPTSPYLRGSRVSIVQCAQSESRICRLTFFRSLIHFTFQLF
jgi:hypothetical protein